MALPRFDVPSPDPETQPYWDAAHAGHLLIQECGTCGAVFTYARPFCPRCWSPDVAWREATGGATLYTWSVVYRNDLPPWNERVPYVAAVVDLDEGPRLLTNVEDCAFEDLTVGLRLAVRFRPVSEDVSLPVFVRASVPGGTNPASPGTGPGPDDEPGPRPEPGGHGA